MMGEVNRSENIRCQVVPSLNKSGEEADICSRVFAEISRGICNRSLEHDGVTAIKRMCNCRFRKHPFQAVLVQRQLPEKGRTVGQRVDRGAGVVYESGQCPLRGTRASADHIGGFKYANGK